MNFKLLINVKSFAELQAYTYIILNTLEIVKVQRVSSIYAKLLRNIREYLDHVRVFLVPNEIFVISYIKFWLLAYF